MKEKTMQNQDIYTKERKRKIALIENFGTHTHTPRLLTKDQLIDCLSAVGMLAALVLWLAV